MKKLLLPVGAILLTSTLANAQCTPYDCNQDLIDEGITYGGTCDSMIMSGVVNQPYDDFESFVVTDNCFDAGLIDESQAGTDIRIANVDNISFTNMPVGISGATDAASYSPPGGGYTTGCARFNGTPTEAGIFNNIINLVADVVVCGPFPIPLNDNDATYVVWMEVKPDPSFTIATSYCESDAAVALTADGTAGGTFTIDGATATSFDPTALGVGSYEVKYYISAQEGASIAPSVDSMTVTVDVVASGSTIYADTDDDGFGDAANSMTMAGCTVPAGYVLNSDDCDDTDDTIYPGAADAWGNSVDENCDGVDGVLGIDEEDLISLDLYPNPTNGIISITISQSGLNKDYFIVDQTGRVISTGVFNSIENEIDLSSVQNGVYYLKIGNSSVSKMIMKR